MVHIMKATSDGEQPWCGGKGTDTRPDLVCPHCIREVQKHYRQRMEDKEDG